MCYSCYPRYQKLRGLHRPNFRKHKQVKRLFIAASPEGCILFITAIKSSVVLKLIVAWKRENIRQEPVMLQKKNLEGGSHHHPQEVQGHQGEQALQEVQLLQEGQGRYSLVRPEAQLSITILRDSVTWW